MRPEKNHTSRLTQNIATLLVGFFVLIAVFSFGVLAGERNWLRDETRLTSLQNEPGNLPEDLNYEQVEKVYDIVRKNYDGELSEQDFMNELKQAIARATGDPYTEFYDSQAAVEFDQDLDGTFTGIGAELGKKDGNLIVVAPLAGYPAEAAGLRPQDVIASIDGEDTSDFTVFEAVTKIRGEEGTDVTLTIVRNQSEVLDIKITRALIDAPSVKYEIVDGFGVLTVSQFSDDTAGLAEDAARAFVEADVDGVVLDLRGNPGGYLDQSTYLAGLWLDDSKLVVEVKKGDMVEQQYFAKGSALLAGLPTVVLINEGSASASEIVAGALQDYQAAQVVGMQSFGKGSVQTISELDAGELLKVTTSRWYTPLGNSIDKEGITPDIEVDRTEEDYEAGNDPQLDRALELL